MRKFNVTVNGASYEVEVEETSGAAAPVSAPAAVPAAPKAAPAPVKPAAPAASAAPAAAAGAVKITAPMPGTILKITVEVGQKISKGDPVCILEAMKMENDIPAPKDGTVASINIQKGASVNSGDILVTLN